MKIDILQHSEGSFNHEQFGEIRMLIDEQGEPWFVGMDVAEALGYSNAQKAVLKHVDGEDKTTVPIWDSGSNYKTHAIIINESGLYSLILSSKLPKAKQFKRWVTAEVLPQIRKTGSSGLAFIRSCTLFQYMLLWFVGKDVAEALGYSNVSDALIKHVDEEDKKDKIANRDSIGRNRK